MRGSGTFDEISMIPVNLTLENFKCYRTNVPTLHLQGVHIACLCGSNGHGKSTLLDAISWALWGDDVHRPQDELIFVGEENMRVELEFIAGGFSSGSGVGQHYRVIRRYARARGARAGATDLQLYLAIEVPENVVQGGLGEFEAVDSQSNGNTEWRSITGNTVRETEAHIVKLVGMDYSTFVNSAFLMQGRADEFTTKRPAERQQVLARVLDLGLYERLQERARQKGREITALTQSLHGQLQVWSQDLEHGSTYKAQLPEVQADLARANNELRTKEETLSGLQQHVVTLRERYQDLGLLRRQVEGLREEIQQLQGQASQNEGRVQRFKEIKDREVAIDQTYQRYMQIKETNDSLTGLVQEYSRLQTQMEPLVHQAQILPLLEKELGEWTVDLDRLQDREQSLDQHRTEIQEIEVQRNTLDAENQRLRQEMDGLKAKIQMLADGDVKCPLCGTTLGAEGKEHINKEYEEQGTNLADQYRKNRSVLETMEPHYTERVASVRGEEQDLDQGKGKAQNRVGTLTQQLDEAREAPQAHEVLLARLQDLGYDPDLHEEVKTTLRELSEAEEWKRQLQEANMMLPEALENMKQVTLLIQRRDESVAQAEKQIETIANEVTTLPELEKRLGEVERAYAETHAVQQNLVARNGFLIERLKEYTEIEEQKLKVETELAALTEQQQIFEELSIAFGRTGVQSLIIEAAIPELEGYANDLLSRMTDNTMHLRLETQRETQRGGSVETLEIKVADDLGTRGYDTFSGGEAFRINLALRIGLSKLLAHRSGAPLPTLFLDEGFGTQDATGRERILDVLQAIGEDFERILVITHMDEIKDAFPVRIEVTKLKTGSTFAIT